MFGNGINLSEGLQLVFSSALSLFVCFGIARPRSYAETIGAVLFYAIVSRDDAGGLDIRSTNEFRPVRFHISVEFYKFYIL